MTETSQPVPKPEEPDFGDRALEAATKAGKFTLVAVLVAGVGFLLVLAAAAFLPRWWAQFVGAQVDGSMTQGTAWGLFYGFVFTLLPVLIIAQARRRFLRGWRTKMIVVVIGLLAALPNWLTLWIVVGTTNAAHAGERILDVDAPGFRAATLIGAVIGLALGLFISGVGIYLRRRKAALKRREAELTILENKREG